MAPKLVYVAYAKIVQLKSTVISPAAGVQPGPEVCLPAVGGIIHHWLVLCSLRHPLRCALVLPRQVCSDLPAVVSACTWVD